MQDYIKVVGNSKIEVTPDYINVIMTITSIQKDYTNAVNELEYKTRLLKSELIKVGFNESDIKTTNYYVKENYIYKENNKKEFDNYIGNHTVEVGFDFNIDTLNMLINTLKNSKANPDFNVEFSLKDTSKSTYILINTALIDANKNAKIIASTLNLNIKSINNVEYLNYPSYYKSTTMLSSNSDTHQIDIVPKDILLSTNIQVTYNI